MVYQKDNGCHPILPQWFPVCADLIDLWSRIWEVYRQDFVPGAFHFQNWQSVGRENEQDWWHCLNICDALFPIIAFLWLQKITHVFPCVSDSEDGKEEGEKEACTGEEEEEDDDQPDDCDADSEGGPDDKTDEEEDGNSEELTHTEPPREPTTTSPSLDTDKPSVTPVVMPMELTEDPLEALQRPLSSLEDMSRAIESKASSVFDKCQSVKVKENIKLPYKLAKVIKEMPRLPTTDPSGRTKDRLSSPQRGTNVPATVNRSTSQNSRSFCHETSYPDSDEPLDLSKKPKTESTNKPHENKPHSKTHYQHHSSRLSVEQKSSDEPLSSNSSLSNLEKRFGGNSFLFDGGAGKMSIPKNPLYQAFGGNLFATALYNTPPLATTDHVYRPHHRSYWPGPIPAPRQTNKHPPAPSASSSTAKPQPGTTKGNAVQREEPGGLDSSHNGKFTNLICACKKQFETLYDLTIHMQHTGHKPPPTKNGDHGDYPKLVRGQDMWLNQGTEQTRQILRCMQCGESFKSLPELTIHMIKTRHYTNIVGAESRKIHKYTSYYSDNEEEERGNVFRCKVCHESFKDMDGLANHMVVSGHHKKHVLKNSGGPVSALGPGISSHDRNSQSPKPLGVPVAPTPSPHGVAPSHPLRATKSPTAGATVATLLESKRKLINGTKSEHQEEQDPLERPNIKDYIGQVDGKQTCIKAERHTDNEVDNDELADDHDVCPSRKHSVIKSEKVTLNYDVEKLDSVDEDLPELNKIRCENCGDRIETPHFVEHVRACVKFTSGRVEAHDEWPKREGRVNDLKHSRPPSPQSGKLTWQVQEMDYRPYKKRSKFGDFNSRPRSHEPERPRSYDHDRPKSHELDRPRSHNPERPRSQDPAFPKSREPDWSKYNDRSLQVSTAKQPVRPGSGTRSILSPQPKSNESHRTKSNELLRPKSPLLHSTTEPMISDNDITEGSALKAMENFIERSFTVNSNKPRFFRSSPLMNGRTTGFPTGVMSRTECHLPDSTAPHIDSYSAQHKYLPPSLPSNIKVESSESPRDPCESPKVKVEMEDSEHGGSVNGKPAAGDSSGDEQGEVPSPKSLQQKYLADEGDVEDGKSSSALQSLQGLVYGRSFSTEHPLDSLQKLIHNTDMPMSGIGRPNGSQQTIVTGMAALQQQGSLPSTVILVNPIVTVMPTSSTSSAVHINISHDSSPPTTAQCSPTSSTPNKASPNAETDPDQVGEFRCQACNRTFASKGSYRYHLSRCHLSSVKRYGIKEAFNMSPYVYLPLDHTAKFNKYYEMANELANKGKWPKSHSQGHKASSACRSWVKFYS